MSSAAFSAPTTLSLILEKVEDEVIGELLAEGTATFWVQFAEQADLSPAFAIKDWAERGQFVYDRLVEVANASQADVIAYLDSIDAEYESFWIVNSIKVADAPLEALLDLAVVSNVVEITADRETQLIMPVEVEEAPDVQTLAVEWGVANVRADQVWEDFGIQGEGIVVGVIDTGARYHHPALINQYRGYNGDGTFDHNYNWFDPDELCGKPSLEPCDDQGHGTHVTGTAVGSDGGSNQIGVAPGAKWIHAKGCNTQGRCFLEQVLASGQFMLAPTDLNGENPRPDLRPHIVSNSWGRSIVDDGFQPMVQAWVAAGMFPSFANGNDGPQCGTVSRPAWHPEAYGVGAHDRFNNIANFSSRGPNPDGDIKPNITAPGVQVRSSSRTGGYTNMSGTSMATPHLSGAVALIWSAAPSLIGDIAKTRELLGATAVPVPVLTCGGTPDNNNVWGQGRLDVYAAVEAVLKPQLTVNSPVDGLVTSGQSVLVSGVATDEHGIASVTVNDEEVDVAPDGSFSIGVLLDEGLNVISVEATNTLDLSTVVTLNVTSDTIPPELTNLEPSEDVVVEQTESLTLRFTSEPGLEAAFEVVLAGTAGLLSTLPGTPMTETSPGVYEGVYTAPADVLFSDAEVWFMARDAAGNFTQELAPGRLTVIPYVDPPTLTITAPADGLRTDKDVITVSGQAEDASGIQSVTVNGRKATVNGDGAFSTRVILSEGENVITVTATSESGKQTTETVTVTAIWSPPELANLEPAEDVTLQTGESVTLRFTAEPGLTAAYQVLIGGSPGTFSGKGAPKGTAMTEVAPGVYEATYTAPANTTFSGAVIRFNAADDVGNLMMVTAPGRLTVQIGSDAE